MVAQHILAIRPGRLPLFTEGFSLLINRLRELLGLDLDLIEKDHRPGADQLAKLKDLNLTLHKWAPYIDLQSPTVTFCGTDLAAPRTADEAVEPSESTGWIQSSAPPPKP
jgi:hypothetical protein